MRRFPFVKRTIVSVLCVALLLTGNLSTMATEVGELLTEVTETTETMKGETVVATETESESETENKTETETETEIESEIETESEQEEVKTVNYTYENDDAIITVSAEEGVLPSEAELSVAPITSGDEYKEVKSQLESDAEENDYEIAGFLAYDICFLVDGEEVEPNGEVSVVIDYKEAAIPESVENAENATVSVMHMEEKNTDVEVKNITSDSAINTTSENAVEKVEFVTDSFSTFTITWTVNGDKHIIVHFVDESGNEIAVETAQDISDLSNGNNLGNQTGAGEFGDNFAALAADKYTIDGYTYLYTYVKDYTGKNYSESDGKKYYNQWSEGTVKITNVSFNNSSNSYIYVDNEYKEFVWHYVRSADLESNNKVWTPWTADSSSQDVYMVYKHDPYIVYANLFDYDKETINNATLALSKTNALIFHTAGGDLSGDAYTAFSGTKWNLCDTVGNSTGKPTAFQGIVKNSLSNNLPVFNYTVADLFDPRIEADKTSVYTNVGIPFEYNNGYYVMDSRSTEYTYDASENKFTAITTSNNGQFMPLGSGNYHFGMVAPITFSISNDGKTNGESTVFQFSGDDDVWVFIDGKLVLDMGGVHQTVSGEINFETGETKVSYAYNSEKEINRTVENHNVYTDSLGYASTEEGRNGLSTGTHTLAVFYVERGAGASNCKITFNFVPSISSVPVDVYFTKTDSEKNALPGAKFGLYASNDTNCTGDALYTASSDNDGKVSFKNVVGGTYRMKEISAPEGYVLDKTIYTVTVNAGTVSLSESGTASTTDGSFTIAKDSGEKVTSIVNYRDEKKAVTVSKVWSDGTDAHSADAITFQLLDGNDNIISYLNETEFVLNAANNWTMNFEKSGLSADVASVVETSELSDYKVSYSTNDTEKNVTWNAVSSFENGKTYVLLTTISNKSYALSEDGNELKYVECADASNASDAQKWIAEVVDGECYLKNSSGKYLYLNGKWLDGYLYGPIWIPGHYEYSWILSDSKIAIEKTEYSDEGELYYCLSSVKNGERKYISESDKEVSASGYYRKSFELYKEETTLATKEFIITNTKRNVTQEKTLTKQKYVNDNGDGTYDLTLTVSGASGTETQKANLDIIFVLDVSNSMTDDGSPNLKNATTAIKNMVKGLEEHNTISAKYSLVTFGTNAKIDTTFTDASTLKKKLPTTAAGGEAGGTNYEAGLLEAKTELGKTRTDAQSVVVFVSDGNPGYYYNDKNEVKGEGNPTKYSESKVALQHARKVISSMSMDYFYTIGVGSNTDSYKYLKILTDSYPYDRTVKADDYKNYPFPTGTAKGNYDGTDETALKKAFDDIQANITSLLCTGVTVTDTLSEYVEYVSEKSDLQIIVKDKDDKLVASGNNSVKLTSDNTTWTVSATWNEEHTAFSLEFPQEYKLQSGYTYYVTAKVQPTELAYNTYATTGYNATGDGNTDVPGKNETEMTSSGKAGFRSNATATVTYTYDGETTTEYYDHPVVQVSASKLILTKYGESNSIVLSGAQFGLYKKTETEYVKVGENYTTDENGQIDFGKLTSGEYKLVEEQAPASYKQTEEYITFTVKEGKISSFAKSNNSSEVWTIETENPEPIVTDNTVTDNTKNYEYNISVFNEKAIVYAWNVVKVSKSDKDLKLAGAEFTLSGETTYFGKSNEDGVVIWYMDDEFSDEATEIAAGDYVLSETKAPSGYSINPETLKISVDSENNIKVNDQTLVPETQMDSESGVTTCTYTISFEDEALYSLPETGGAGIFAYMFGGMFLMMAGALYIFVCRRKAYRA